MTPEEKQRIENEARLSFMNPPRPYTDNHFITGYIAGATAEHERKLSKAQELYNYIEAVTLRTEHQHSPHTQDLLRYLKSNAIYKEQLKEERNKAIVEYRDRVVAELDKVQGSWSHIQVKLLLEALKK